ncbi:unnamed protein product [Kuraishia capsulata CBS 1993]|uniref:Sulfite reductase [NADPH] subunit beta n=1 Tax=Kuraishia capsulata CBS 1993 TaxID=1382522 RepID=W6MU50_9ASCO|nr:uncharacterized protein KUCA_T00006058001 [Kuraishia capsulata CBS 1993]CDK30063.1 unnamed protein product [Kuraishia capsulata CBS 1993]
MTASQSEAVANAISAFASKIYISQPAKSVNSKISAFLEPTATFQDSNDPLLVISDLISESDVTAISLSPQALIQGLPYLSSLKERPVVIHVELQDGNFSIVSALKDSGLPIVLSYTAQDSQDVAIAAYALAKSGKAILHFYSPSDDKTKLIAASRISSIGAVDTLEEAFKVVKALTWTSYSKFEYSGPSKAETAFVVLGGAGAYLAKPANAQGAGIIKVRSYQPFDTDSLISVLPKNVKKLLVLEQSHELSSNFQSFMLDFFRDFNKLIDFGIEIIVSSKLLKVSHENSKSIVETLLTNANLAKPVQNLTLGANFESDFEELKTLQQAKQSAVKLEDAYMKILNQVYGSNLNILNSEDSEGSDASTTPEFGYGKFLYAQDKRSQLEELVHNAISSTSFGVDSVELVELLTKWLVSSKSGSATQADSIIELLKKDGSETAAKLLELQEYFDVKSSWIVGSDSWSYDLGSSGVHNVLASGKNVNMLIIDSTPFSDVKANKAASRKKDVGLYAMNFGGCYVASVAVYSSYTQVLQAFIEAGKYDGPSIVLAYLPYKSEADDSLEVLKETKVAVDSGYWPLYRYQPTTSDFALDSTVIRRELEQFLERENKLTMLSAKNPEFSRNLKFSHADDVKSKQQNVARDAYSKLLESLTGAPLTIAFASDGGNAESLAKKLGRRGASRGLKTTVLPMDDLTLEDFAVEENVVFITSTSGQGEFPQNGKAFWDALKSAADLDLTTVKVSTFGLGDSLYWPRKEDKHYYNKPAKDLSARLSFLQAQELAPLGLGDDQDADGYSTGYDAWEALIWEALGVSGQGNGDEPPPITNEDMKIASNFLRGTIVQGLQDQSTGAISASDQQMTKFHGIYMQDDRDIRDERKASGLEPAYAFMARVRLPGGAATPKQWLKIDELADVRGNGTLKITTRATFQLHGLVKHNLKAAIRGMNSVLMDTLGACGDVNRNVMVSALPGNAKVHAQIAKSSYVISEHLLPQTTAYHEIWLEGADENDSSPKDSRVWENRPDGPKKTKTLVSGNALVDYEPFYGPTYLPRKFKVVITVPPYNDVDVYAHDVGLVAIVDENDIVTGYNVLAGGGMGTTHNNKKTYPRTGSMLGYAPIDQVHIVCEKIMLVQRDNGDRKNRKHARLKYTIDDMGQDVFKSKVEELWGQKFAEAKPFEIKSNIDYFGWVKDELNFNHFTCFIENGRVEDTADLPQKTGLRELAKYMDVNGGEFRLTGNQHLVISNITDEDITAVKEILYKYKLDNTNFSALRLSSGACVAFPTCGLAMAESERYLPVLISKIENALEEYGLRHDSVVMRMTGCPNGCARPWLAEVALVGKAYGAYNLLLGGGYHGQRLNKLFRSSIKEDEILAILKPLFKRWSLERHEGEHFGDFLIRAGVINPTTEGKYFHDDVPVEA